MLGCNFKKIAFRILIYSIYFAADINNNNNCNINSYLFGGYHAPGTMLITSGIFFSFSPCKAPVKQVLLLSSIYRRRLGVLERELTGPSSHSGRQEEKPCVRSQSSCC